MAKKKFVVRVTIPALKPILMQLEVVKPIDGAFLECLRYAGIITVHYDDERGQSFDIYRPSGVDTEAWAKMNANRMASFGYDATTIEVK